MRWFVLLSDDVDDQAKDWSENRMALIIIIINPV